MSSFCGWANAHLGADVSRQTISTMLAECREPSTADATSDCDSTSAIGFIGSNRSTNYIWKDGNKAVIAGAPTWDDPRLSDLCKQHGPAAALLEAYHLYGRDLLSRLHGPFALAVLDDSSALIAIDRIGIHTLSYALQNGTFVFSTSTGSVVRHPEINRQISPQAIFNYIYFNDVPSPGTIYSGVEKLQPAQYVEFRDGQLDNGFYWQLHYDDHKKATFSALKHQFREILRHTVADASGDSEIAAFLSGGTDSSTVTGILAALRNGPVDTYSIGFGADGFDEMEYARLAARHFGATAHEYYMKPEDILEAIPLIVETYDEPFANESTVPAYFCAKQAANNGVKVMLAGDGGDEIFGGNERYAKQLVFEHYNRLPGFVRNRLIEPVADFFPRGDSFMPVRKLRSYIRQASVALPERMESYNFIYRQPMEEMFAPEFLDLVNPDMPAEMLRDAYFRADSKHPVNRMLHLDMKFTLADNDLRKVSRMCEAAGIEVRYPLLDEAMVNFSGQLPVEYKVRGHKLRWFFKEALKDFLPREILTKSKHGFGLPFGIWALKHAPLRELVDDTLNRFKDRGFLKAGFVEEIGRQHAGEHPTYFGKMIWVMVILELWLETHGTK